MAHHEKRHPVGWRKSLKYMEPMSRIELLTYADTNAFAAFFASRCCQRNYMLGRYLARFQFVQLDPFCPFRGVSARSVVAHEVAYENFSSAMRLDRFVFPTHGRVARPCSPGVALCYTDYLHKQEGEL